MVRDMFDFRTSLNDKVLINQYLYSNNSKTIYERFRSN
jgi:hypothetical protein